MRFGPQCVSITWINVCGLRCVAVSDSDGSWRTRAQVLDGERSMEKRKYILFEFSWIDFLFVFRLQICDDIFVLGCSMYDRPVRSTGYVRCHWIRVCADSAGRCPIVSLRSHAEFISQRRTVSAGFKCPNVWCMQVVSGSQCVRHLIVVKVTREW